MAEGVIEGVDFKNLIVTLPADAKRALRRHEGLEVFFETMSFSHKKEYVEAIVEAKKPETRQRRIEKMIEMVSAMKAERTKEEEMSDSQMKQGSVLKHIKEQFEGKEVIDSRSPADNWMGFTLESVEKGTATINSS